METSRRLQVRLSSDLVTRVEELAGEHRISLSDAIRIFVARGALERTSSPDSVALAAAVAAEHSLALLASFLPDGQRRLAELSPRAVQATRERIALLAEGEVFG